MSDIDPEHVARLERLAIDLMDGLLAHTDADGVLNTLALGVCAEHAMADYNAAEAAAAESERRDACLSDLADELWELSISNRSSEREEILAALRKHGVRFEDQSGS